MRLQWGTRIFQEVGLEAIYEPCIFDVFIISGKILTIMSPYINLYVMILPHYGLGLLHTGSVKSFYIFLMFSLFFVYLSFAFHFAYYLILCLQAY